MIWSTACPDWEERILSGQSLIPFEPLFPTEAALALETFRELRIVDVAGSPTIGESCRPWLMDFAGAIFGAYDQDSGRRLIREFMLLVSKKNSKSTTAAAIMMTALLRNWRRSNEFLILAPTIEIANNSFKPAADMVADDERLRALLHVQTHTRTITHRTTGAVLKVVAADNETVGGKKAAGVLVDELWMFGKQAGAENMLREATGGLTSRPEGFVIYLSTQSDDAPAGIFKQKLNYFRGVRDGRIQDNRSLGVLYEFPKSIIESKGYLEPENFRVTNPNLGASVDAEFIGDELRKAQEAGPHSLCGFLAKHLNIEIGLAHATDRWAGAEHWEKNGDPRITFEYILENCDLITVGIDGGGLDDLLGFAVIGRHRVTRDHLHWGHAWAHPSALQQRQDIASRLLDFVQDGDLTLVERIGDDVAELAQYVLRIYEDGLFPVKAAIGVDQAGIGSTLEALAEVGIDVRPETGFVVGVPQGWWLNGVIKDTERRLAGGRFKHGASPMMAWCVGNARVEQRGNAITITKQISGSAKIDPLMAIYDSEAAMMRHPEAGSVFDAMGDEEDAESGDADDADEPSEEDDRRILMQPNHPQYAAARQRHEMRVVASDDEW